MITRPPGGPGAAADPPSAAQPADPSDLRAASERRRSRRFPRETFNFLHDKSSVRPVDLQQMLGFAVLHDLSRFQENDPIKIPQRREPMRDGDDGSSPHEARKRVADRLLGFDVES